MEFNRFKRIRSVDGRLVFLTLALVVAVVLFATAGGSEERKNGFLLDNALVPVSEIHHGGPPRDGIPAIDHPKFMRADDAAYLDDMDRVLGISRNGVAKAYPIRILNYHEIVNDDFNGEAVVVTFCPLCGTGMAFLAGIDGVAHTFGVSGLLYNSDVLLYDRQTESLWSQILGQAVSGKYRGRRLDMINSSHTTWRDWRKRHPRTLVLSTDTGFRRNYARSPYSGYAKTPDVYFPVSHVNPRYHPKESVIGIGLEDRYKAYPFSELSRTSGVVHDRFAGRQLKIVFDPENRTGKVLDARGREISSVIAYWFAWAAFHPETEIYSAGAPGSGSKALGRTRARE